METYKIEKDIKTLGVEVKDFPEGISEAFDSLVEMLPGGFSRSFYGIIEMRGTDLLYKATAEELYEGEAEQYNCDRSLISKGEYLAETIRDWRGKTNSIKDVFQSMIQDSRADRNKPAIEWYKSNEEMVCLVPCK